AKTSFSSSFPFEPLPHRLLPVRNGSLHETFFAGTAAAAARICCSPRAGGTGACADHGERIGRGRPWSLRACSLCRGFSCRRLRGLRVTFSWPSILYLYLNLKMITMM
ncbi:unnamed protein product, partial [Musa textilis]